MALWFCLRSGFFFHVLIVVFKLAIIRISVAQEHGEVRITGGNSTSGTVEVYIDDKWRMICADTSWDLDDAHVTCRQLGFSAVGVLAAVENDDQDNRTESLNNLGCLGSESLIINCPYDQSEGCSGGLYAYVDCLAPDIFEEGQIRFTDGNETAGRVEVFLEGRWRTVCGYYWDFNKALVVCRQRGFKGVYEFVPEYFEIHRTGVFTDLFCEGYEQTILDCEYMLEDTCDDEDAVVSCKSYDRGDVRIVGANTTSGRVEVNFEMQWVAVCADGWDLTDAHVVCRQLGFMEAVWAFEDTRSQPDLFYLSQVDCFGNEEELLDCAYTTSQDCKTNSYASVVCKAPENGMVQLVGGSDMFSGRLEIFLRGEWGSVCDYCWDLEDANVVCRQLGYGNALRHTGGSFPFGAGTGPILSGCLECRGNETDLLSCSRYSLDFCHHTEDAGVVCELSNFARDLPVRLRGAIGTPYSGRVEILVQDQWGTICDDQWDIRDANVVCRQLGFGVAIDATIQASFGEGNGPIVFTQLDCNGTETNLWDCTKYLGIGSGNNVCSHNRDAGVMCSGRCIEAECPANVQTTLESGSDEVVVSWVEPSSVDSQCGAVTFTSSHSPGDRFQEGVTIVSYLFEDTSGAQDNCNFTVEVTTREGGIPVVAVFIPSCAFVALIISILLLRRFKVPKQLWERSLPPLPKAKTPSNNPAYIHSEESCSDNEYIAIEDNNDNSIYHMVGKSCKVEKDITDDEKLQKTVSQQRVDLPSFADQDNDFKGINDVSTVPGAGNFYFFDNGHFFEEKDNPLKNTAYEVPRKEIFDPKTESLYAYNIEGDVIQEETPIYFEHNPSAGMDSQDGELNDDVFASEDDRGQLNSQEPKLCNAALGATEMGDEENIKDDEIMTRQMSTDDDSEKDASSKANNSNESNVILFDMGEF